MLEIPEAAVVAGQLTDALAGRVVVSLVAGHSPHRFAFFSADPAGYEAMLQGRTVTDAAPVGGMVELRVGGMSLLVNDGVRLRHHAPGSPLPRAHQLLVGFDDGSALSATVQMYGALLCHPSGTCDNPYYLVAREKPSPLAPGFDLRYFEALMAPDEVRGMSLKAALATQQRIPGLGNGVLQDILWSARMHPRQKVSGLGPADLEQLHAAIVAVLTRMAALGGRDTETDLFGRPGGYPTVMSRLHVGQPCPGCGTPRVKQSYLGGSIHFCPRCQPA